MLYSFATRRRLEKAELLSRLQVELERHLRTLATGEFAELLAGAHPVCPAEASR